MDAAASFPDFFAQVRAKDDAAVTRLIDLYDPILLHIARRRLRKHGLSRLLDAEDIRQEVFLRFFSRVIEKRNLASLREVHALLVTMTINVIRDEARRAGRLRRGSGRPAKKPASLEVMPSSEHEPSYDLGIEEQIEEIHQLLSEEEWGLAWARASGKTWRQIAKEFGRSASALRSQYARAVAQLKDKLTPK